ncbi:MAG: 1-acyl-sn-glycerol-3-phosphate acyltransferase [Candidatus Hydrogenedentes bacterium]|nr:1-acyl-sn-glycerol-3-phosphate acyltransferase [Candidatus Hydrogenedentota bacterium]
MKLLVALRVGWRMLALAVWTLSLFSLRLVSKMLGLYSLSLDQRTTRRLLYRWAGGVARIVNMKLEVRGTPPSPPFYLVTNHLSYIDVLLLARTAGCVYVSRADVEQWPVVGFIARMMNTCFIDRARVRDTKRVNDLIAGLLDKGYGVHMFAESKIAQDAQIHPFKPPLLEPAVQKGCAVHYAAISYSTPVGSPRAADVIIWKDGVSFMGNMINVLGLPGFSAVISFGDKPIQGDDRKELADKLYRAVLERFTPVG